MSDKVQARHVEHKAILYVRQSSAFQVANNQESRVLQYAMQQRLRDLGWQEIEVIDEDLGRSAAGAVVRTGFERMVVGTTPLRDRMQPTAETRLRRQMPQDPTTAASSASDVGES